MKIYNDFDLTDFNSYRVSSKCAKAYFPETEQDIYELFSSGKDYIILGNGFNIILSKEYYEEEFIIFNGNFDTVNVVNTTFLEVEAGASMSAVSEIALANCLSGIEVFFDIPSSLGGAIVMNAGAGGEEIKDVLTYVRYLDLADMKIKEINKSEMSFEYRNSFFQRYSDKVILKAKLELILGESETIRAKMYSIKEARWAKQPKEYPNAGSVFKRPKGYYVGAIIDELSLKGFSCGGAMVSLKHGGFIINYNNATGQDIIQLITEIKKRTYDRFGIDLEVEQRII